MQKLPMKRVEKVARELNIHLAGSTANPIEAVVVSGILLANALANAYIWHKMHDGEKSYDDIVEAALEGVVDNAYSARQNAEAILAAMPKKAVDNSPAGA